MSPSVTLREQPSALTRYNARRSGRESRIILSISENQLARAAMAPAAAVLAARGRHCAAACGGRLHVGAVDTGVSGAVSADMWAPVDGASEADELVAAATEPRTVIVLRARASGKDAVGVGYERLFEL
jgi:hypothetical protein